MVRGHFEGKHPNVLNYYGYDPIGNNDNPKVFDVSDDGTFMAVIPVENPILDYLIDSRTRRDYYFYVSAGDTLDITIDADGTVTYPEKAEYVGLMRLMSNESPQIIKDYDMAQAKADSLPMADYAEWLDAELTRRLTVADYVAMRRGLTPREAHLLRNKVLLDCGYFICLFDESFKLEENMNPANYVLTRRMPVDDLSGLSLPREMGTLVNQYEFYGPIFRQLSDTDPKGYTSGIDSTAIAADKVIMGTDRPSRLLQMAWLNIVTYKTDYSWDPEATLKDIDNRRLLMTSDYLKGRLDAIRES